MPVLFGEFGKLRPCSLKETESENNSEPLIPKSLAPVREERIKLTKNKATKPIASKEPTKVTFLPVDKRCQRLSNFGWLAEEGVGVGSEKFSIK